MSTTILHAPCHAPSGAPSARFWPRLWAALEAQGQRRAAAELRRIAVRHAGSDPELSRQLLEAAAQADRR